jgi:hypothetical protein
MNNIIINEALLIMAILATGIVYGTDMFYAIVIRKASALSKDSSIADLTGNTHLVADKRMPGIGITSVICTATFIILNFKHAYAAYLSGTALLMLLLHLSLYMAVAKPINKKMSAAAADKIIPANIRELQNRWDSVITYRAAFLTAAMFFLIITAINCDK